MNDLVVWNQGNVAVTIQGHQIAAGGGNYSIPFADLDAWAVDPFLRAYILSGQCYLVAVGVRLDSDRAFDWLEGIFFGSIVYSS